MLIVIAIANAISITDQQIGKPKLKAEQTEIVPTGLTRFSDYNERSVECHHVLSGRSRVTCSKLE